MLRYRLILEPDDNGTILVTSPDLPIVTYGDTEAEALRYADDAINTIIESMMDARELVPTAEIPEELGVIYCAVSLQTELKVRLHNAMREADLTRADLQRQLGWQRESVDRLFRIDHNSRLDQIEAAFHALNKGVSLQISDAA